jgi:Ca2+-binding EF-hand superfamily protein
MEFEPYAAFSRIDRAYRGLLTARDLLEFMHSCGMGHLATESDLTYLVKYYDSDPTAHQQGYQLDYQE